MNLYLAKSKHPAQGKINFQGLPIVVENKAGSVRHWHDPHSNESGETRMEYPYGYVKGTLGLDGDEVDVFVGPKKDSKKVFVITQMRRDLAKDGDFEFKHVDEQKVMLGFESKKQAIHAYNRHYDDYRFFGSVKKMKIDEFKEQLKARKGKLIKHLYIAEQSANIQPVKLYVKR